MQRNFSFASLWNSELKFADTREADAGATNLMGANLHHANLEGENLHRANLRGADLSGANLNFTDLRQAQLERATLCGTKMPWGEDHSGCAE